MSFLTDLFEGNTGNLGNDITHAPSSLASHPDELAETIGGAAALATGGLALGADAGLFGAGAGADAAIGGGVDTGGLFSGIFGDTSAATGAIGTSGDSLIAPALNTGADVPGSLSSYASTAADASGGVPLPQAAPGYGGPPADAFGNPIGGGPSPDPYAGGSPSLGANPSQGGGLIGPQAPPGATAQPGFLDGITNSIMNPTLSGVGKVAGVAAAGAGLGFDLLKGNPTDPNQKMLQAQAGQLSAQGQQLESYLKNGTLPPALQAQLKQATAAEKARIVSGYAARNQPTDPNQNSALAQELNAVDTNAIAAMADAQIQLLNTGIKETGMSTEIYNILTKLDMQNNQQLMQAISSFAAALGGGGGGQTVRLATS
jgi:hypothetical protein